MTTEHSSSGSVMSRALETPLTMSSREIAELTGKQHQHVRRDVKRMFDALKSEQIDPSIFGRIYLDERNREQTEFLLPKRECLILDIETFGRRQDDLIKAVGASMQFVEIANDPGTYVSTEWVDVEGVYRIAGQQVPVLGQRSLSSRITRSLDAFCIDQRRQMDIANSPWGKQRIWRIAAVRAWLKDRGRSLIDQHLAKHGDQNVIRFPGPFNGEAH